MKVWQINVNDIYSLNDDAQNDFWLSKTGLLSHPKRKVQGDSNQPFRLFIRINHKNVLNLSILNLNFWWKKNCWCMDFKLKKKNKFG